MIFSSVDEWAFNLGLGGHGPDSSRGCCHRPTLVALGIFWGGEAEPKIFLVFSQNLIPTSFKPGLSHRKLRNGQAGPSPAVAFCTKRYPYYIRMITN